MQIIDGTLLGDANIRVWKGKYFYYKCVAKDQQLLGWLKSQFEQNGITNSYIGVDNNITGCFAFGFYINKTKDERLLGLRKGWYVDGDDKTQKIVPKDLFLTPVALLHWYIGDGSMNRHGGNRKPYPVLATNCFRYSDIQLLVTKLREKKLDFAPQRQTDGSFVLVGRGCTAVRFFKLIGLEPPDQISGCITGRKGRGRRLHYIRDKWPTEDDWLKLLSDEPAICHVLVAKREQLDLTRSQFAKKAGVSYDYLKRIEWGKRQPSVQRLRQLLEALALKPLGLLEEVMKLGEEG
ncbi:MAG: helix-turn-helix domain-containing protein [Candidatus Aenigmatarchaeota archaeon]